MADELELRTVTVGDWRENCYVLRDPTSGAALIVDPGDEPERILAALGDAAVSEILITHAHADHVGAVEAVRAATRAPVAIHAAELPALGAIHHDRLIADGEELRWGAQHIRAIHTPGHTPGMLSFIVNERLAIVGDTIFGGGPGRTVSPEDFQTTLATLREIILRWPESYVCYPGHGEPFSLGAVRERIARFAAHPRPADFHGDAEW